MTDLLLARKPLFNHKLEVTAYAFSYSAAPSAVHNTLNTIFETGLDSLVGDQGQAYIPIDRSFLSTAPSVPYLPGRLIFEIPADILSDPGISPALDALQQKKCSITVSGITSFEELEPHLNRFSTTAFDVKSMPLAAIQAYAVPLRKRGVKLLAKNIPTRDSFNACKDREIDVFQGDFFFEPGEAKGKWLDASRLVITRLLAQLDNPSVDFKKLEKIISQDIALSYRMLRMVNSTYYATTNPVTSINHAIAYIGTAQLRRTLTMLLMASFNEKPHELTSIAMTRARMCENLARGFGGSKTDSYFMVGLFSVLDTLTDAPLEQVMANLPIADEIKLALLQKAGRLGYLLEVVLAYERCEWDTLADTDFKPGVLLNAYLDAVSWTTTLTASMRR